MTESSYDHKLWSGLWLYPCVSGVLINNQTVIITSRSSFNDQNIDCAKYCGMKTNWKRLRVYAAFSPFLSTFTYIPISSSASVQSSTVWTPYQPDLRARQFLLLQPRETLPCYRVGSHVMEREFISSIERSWDRFSI